jgi:hypothetical protein
LLSREVKQGMLSLKKGSVEKAALSVCEVGHVTIGENISLHAYRRARTVEDKKMGRRNGDGPSLLSREGISRGCSLSRSESRERMARGM